MNILIIDDDPYMRGMLFQIIKSIGKHEVSLLTNGYNAASLLADPQHGFDLVFIDSRMPRLSGGKVIEIIQDFIKVNFVVLTGHPEDITIKAKNIKVFKKPIDYTLIEKLILEAEKNQKPKANQL